MSARIAPYRGPGHRPGSGQPRTTEYVIRLRDGRYVAVRFAFRSVAIGYALTALGLGHHEFTVEPV